MVLESELALVPAMVLASASVLVLAFVHGVRGAGMGIGEGLRVGVGDALV